MAAELAGPASVPAAAAAESVNPADSAPTPLPEVPPAPAPLAPRADADHIRALYVQTPATLAGNLIGMLLMAGIFWPLSETWRIGGWLAAVAALWLLRLAHYLRFRRQRDADAATLRRWRTSWKTLVLAQGAM